MPDTEIKAATTEPVQVAQTPVEKVSTGKVGFSDFARKLAGNKTAYAYAAPLGTPIEAKAATPAPVTEEAPAPSAEAKTEEPKTDGGEPPTETAEATPEDAEEVPSNETQTLDPKLQEKINRRIGKEVGKTKKAIERATAAETRLTQLEAQLASGPQEVEKEIHVPVPSNVPLAEYDTPDKLNAFKEALSNDIIEAEGLLYGDFPPEGVMTKWSPNPLTKSQIATMLTEAKKVERTQIPAREKFLTTQNQTRQAAHEEFTFLKDRSHPGYAMAQQALRDNPVLHAYPNKDYLVGLIVEGKLALEARKGAKVSAEAKVPVKPKARPTNGQSEIASDASPTRAPTGLMASNALQSERASIVGSKKSLGHKDFAALLRANQRNRNSQ